MEPIKLQDIAGWVNGRLNGQRLDVIITGISTDTRTIKPGDIFIPLVGENFDGHSFIKAAIDKGISAFIHSGKAPEDKGDCVSIRVADTLIAYQKIAHNYLKNFSVPVVAVTGSNGKTTTKDIVSHLLGMRKKVLSTEKNFNNEIGVPQTIMKLDSSVNALVIEMGMRGKGQIRQLSGIVEPDIAVITNIGESHFELLGSYKAIAGAKCEILEHLKPYGTAILNADDKWFHFCAERSPGRIITFGIDEPAYVKLVNKEDLGLSGYRLEVKIGSKFYDFTLPLLGNHNIYNALAGIAVSINLGISPEDIAEGLASLAPPEKRMNMKTAPGGFIVLDDTYNASPSSTGKALEILKNLKAEGRKIAVLGDMLELGDIAVESHRKIGALVCDAGAADLHVMGDLGKEIAKGAESTGMNKDNIKFWDNRETLGSYLREKSSEGDIILVKGSRMMKMEEIVACLLNPNPEVESR